MRASSKDNPSINSYTDVILIQSNGTTGDVPFATSGAASTSTFALNNSPIVATSTDAGATATSTANGTSSVAASGSSSSTTAQATGSPAHNDNGSERISSSIVMALGSVAIGMSLLL